MPEPIFITSDKGHKVRVLSPFDYDKIVSNIDKDYLRTIFNVCFWSGMRYVEVQRFYDHPEWWLRERNTIHLPREAQKKVKRVAPERYIHPIPPQLVSELPYFFKNKRPPAAKVWNENLKRWMDKTDVGREGIVPKTTRKSIESWMYVAGLPMNFICLRQGHDSFTSMNHYQALPFTEAEKSEIKRRLAGWV
jgi:hypothetical protein